MEGGSFAGGPWGICEGRLWKQASVCIGASLGDLGVGIAACPGTLRERWDFILSGDLVYWGLCEICNRRLWKQAAVCIGAPLGNLEAGSFYRGIGEADERRLWKWSVSVYGSSMRGTWREGFFTGTLRDM
jgi:hypothetical protein